MYVKSQISTIQNTDVPAPALTPLVERGAKAGGSCSKGFSDWLASSVCAVGAACPFESAGDWRGSVPWTICLSGYPHNKEGPRMVLVHVGYLVLPVFGSVRNRGMTGLCIFIHPNPNKKKNSSATPFVRSSSPPVLNVLERCKQS